MPERSVRREWVKARAWSYTKLYPEAISQLRRWQDGQKYVERAMSPWRKRSMGVPQSRHGLPLRM